MSGTVACVVEGDGEHPERRHLLSVTRGRVSISETVAERPDVEVRGAVEDWIHALGPGGDLDALRVRGPRGLADALLGGLSAAAARATAVA